MEWPMRRSKSAGIVSLLLVVFLLGSCKQTKNIPQEYVDPDPISDGRLFKNISDNELDFEFIHAKKMEITFKRGKESKSIKATMRVQRDSFIWVSMTGPMGIGEGRLLLTPDSIKFYNSYDKVYFVNDHSYLLEKLDMDISFHCLQKILTNQFFSFESCFYDDVKPKRFKRDISEGKYMLYTMEERAMDRKLKKLDKKKRKNKEFVLVMQKILIDPLLFRPAFVSIEDLDEGSGITVTYHKFSTYGEKLFPEVVSFNLFSPAEKIVLKLEFGKLEFDVPVRPSFKIPARYTKME